MIKKLASAALIASLCSVPAHAHEVWLERDGATVRAYVGDKTGDVDTGEAITKLVSTSKLFGRDPDRAQPVTAHDDHLSAHVNGDGDIRYFNDQLWSPWESDGKYKAAAFQAKAGRSETTPVFDFELVPTEPGSDSFTLIFQGEPVADMAVTVINPRNWEKPFTTDADGRFTVPVTETGLYVLVARHEALADVEIAGRQVSTLQHIASLSFVAE